MKSNRYPDFVISLAELPLTEASTSFAHVLEADALPSSSWSARCIVTVKACMAGGAYVAAEFTWDHLRQQAAEETLQVWCYELSDAGSVAVPDADYERFLGVLGEFGFTEYEGLPAAKCEVTCLDYRSLSNRAWRSLGLGIRFEWGETQPNSAEMLCSEPGAILRNSKDLVGEEAIWMEDLSVLNQIAERCRFQISVPDGMVFAESDGQTPDDCGISTIESGKLEVCGVSYGFASFKEETSGVAPVRPAIIQRHPRMGHGEPTFPGTRVPLQTLRHQLASGSSVAEFCKFFPSVSSEQVSRYLSHKFETLKG